MGEYKTGGIWGSGYRTHEDGMHDYYALCGRRCNIVSRGRGDRETIITGCMFVWGIIFTIIILGIMSGLLYQISAEGGRPSDAFVAYFIVVIIFTLLMTIVVFFYLFYEQLTIKRRVFVMWVVIITYFILLVIAIIYYSPVAATLVCTRQNPDYPEGSIPITYFTTQVFGRNFYEISRSDPAFANIAGVTKKGCQEVLALWIFAILLAVVLLFASLAPFCLFCGDNYITGRRRGRGAEEDDDEPPDDASDVGSASVGKSSSKSGSSRAAAP